MVIYAKRFIVTMNKIKKVFSVFIIFIICFLANFSFSEIVFEGVIGNSGEYGETLSDVPTYGIYGTTGLYKDKDGNFWTAGKPGYIYCYSKEGKVIGRYAFKETGAWLGRWVAHGRIVSDGENLYFLVKVPPIFKLYSFSLSNKTFKEIPLDPYNLSDFRTNISSSLDSNGNIYTYLVSENQPTKILTINIKTGKIEELFTLKQAKFIGLLDYCSSDTSLFIGYGDGKDTYLGKFNLKGESFPNFPVQLHWSLAYTSKPHITGNYLWCTHTHPISRFKIDGSLDPGIIEIVNSHYDSHAPGQILLEGEKLYLTRNHNRGILVGRLDEDEEKIYIEKRFGGINAYGIILDENENLYTLTGNWNWPEQGYLGYFKKDSKPYSPLIEEVPIPIHCRLTGIVRIGKRFYYTGIPQQNQPTKIYGFLDIATRVMSRICRLEYPKDQLSQPYGISTFQYPDEKINYLYLTDAEKNSIKRVRAFDRYPKPDEMKNIFKLQEIDLDRTSLNKPKGICFDKEGNLYITDETSVYKFNRVEQVKYKLIYKVTNWAENDGFKNAFGISVTGENLFVVDKDNHRILRFKTDGSFIESYGQKGKPGPEKNQLNSPTYITADENFIYVSDTGNYRILKLRYIN